MYNLLQDSECGMLDVLSRKENLVLDEQTQIMMTSSSHMLVCERSLSKLNAEYRFGDFDCRVLQEDEAK